MSVTKFSVGGWRNTADHGIRSSHFVCRVTLVEFDAAISSTLSQSPTGSLDSSLSTFVTFVFRSHRASGYEGRDLFHPLQNANHGLGVTVVR